MAYQDRLQPQIVLTSPSGVEFSAKWVGNVRTLEKELGIFKTPNVRGIKLQDLDVRGGLYPLTFFFDGPDNDRESDRFFTTCSENGQWSVIHPVHGTKNLQLVTVSEAVQPVTSGNVTEITSEWLEVSGDEGAKSTTQLASETIAQNGVLQETTADQLNRVVTLDTADKAGKFKTAVENTVKAFNNSLEFITVPVAEIQSQADSIKRGIDSVLLGTPVDVLSIAGQLQALINLPNLVVTDLNTKIESYVRFSNLVFDFSPESATPAEINTAAVVEITQTTTLGAVGVASVTTALSSRQNVIDNIESNIDLFNSITNGLDDIQELYDDLLISRSYFSQSESFGDAALLSGLTLAYLIKSVFDLAVEKKITLTEQENPVMIAMREYGGPGLDDENIDLFYDSNELTGQETFLLPVGKEVVVYI